MTEPSQPRSTSTAPTLPATPQQAMDYWIDGWQRAVLFWDVLRQRSDQYYAQKAKPVPNVLSFDAELVLDGRTLEHGRSITCWCGSSRPQGSSST